MTPSESDRLQWEGSVLICLKAFCTKGFQRQEARQQGSLSGQAALLVEHPIRILADGLRFWIAARVEERVGE